MKNKKAITRKGFTLVELLIVIVVIGILSAMMMMSSTEAVSSAKASNIVSNLRNLKTAALAYYLANMDECNKPNAEVPKMENVIKYLNNGVDLPDYKDKDGKELYTVEGAGTSVAEKHTWFIKHTINGTAEEKELIQKKLAGRAKSIGLLADAKVDAAPYAAGTGESPKDVYMFVR